jgi:CheY-like chemotaxis protein
MRTILAIDDDADVREYLKETFRSSPYRLLLASNGKEAMCILNSHPCELVITDIFMPIAEGLNTIVKIRQFYPGMKIIAVSGGGILGIGDYLDHALIYGADVALQKPLDSFELLQQVDLLLSEEHSLAVSLLM